MPEPDRILAVVGEWVEKAEHDLAAAAHMLQAALVLRAREFPRTHDMWEILELVPEALRPALSVTEARRMTEYATITRYPGDYDPITATEAREAVVIARRVRNAMRKVLSGSRRRGTRR